MNRMEEYESLLEQMSAVPDSDPVGNAVRRNRRRHRVQRMVSGVAAMLCIFVGMINLSPTVSAACRELPLLRELVEVLTFNPSLRIAIEHDYVQMVGQEQTKDGITARVEYLIVDQKQVNIFYTLTSQDGTSLDATPEVLDSDGNHVHGSIVSYGDPGEENRIRKIVVDFVQETVPDQICLRLKVRPVEQKEARVPVDSEWEEIEPPEVLTELSFALHFDPLYTAQGRTVTVNQTAVLNGQTITVTDMEIYPTHLRINIQEDNANTAWLVSLRFYLELEDGQKIMAITNGISATGSETSPSMVSYRAESTYFYEADCLRLIITGADFLEKDRELVKIDLKTLESDPLPQGVSIKEVKQTEKGTVLTFLIPETEETHSQLLNGTYFGPDGTEYYCSRMSSTLSDDTGWKDETYYLDDYVQPEVQVKMTYSGSWTPETPLVIVLMEK